MLLAVDVGNTRTKAAVFEGDAALEFFVFDKAALQDAFFGVFKKYPRIDTIVSSSVGNEIIDFAIPNNITVHAVDHTWKFGFENLYETPLTLGVDRMVLAAGAVAQFPQANRLVIDTGTCITYDFIDDRDRYHGGAISPGISLRYQALHRFTSKLPLLNVQKPNGIIGKSTSDSIHSGVVNGVINEIDGFIDSYRGGAENFIIILTGGDADFLANQLKNTIFANQNFLLESLNKTYIQNKND